MTFFGQVTRLSVSLVALLFVAVACTLALDTEKLNSQTVEDGGDADLSQDVGPIDMKACEPGAGCQVVGQKGACSRGTLACLESGSGRCNQVVQPSAETCDGKDTNCNGQNDKADNEAHIACGDLKYCDGSACVDGCAKDEDCGNGNTCNTETAACVCGDGAGCSGDRECVEGKCLCGGTIACGPGDTCADDKCVCGSKSSSSGPACAQPNPRCVAGSCACDNDSVCKSPETCGGGACTCGSESKPTGPFCPQTICIPAESKCEGVPVDLGPDITPDVGVDQGLDQGRDGDGPPVDAPIDSADDTTKPDVGVDVGPDADAA